MKTLISGNINQFKHLSQFKSLKDFNNNIEQWMLDIKDKFTKSELIALKRFVRFGGNEITGVVYAKIQTIVSATQKFDGVGVSRSTFKRMLNKAKELGFISIHHTFKYGKQGHSVYVFNRYVSSVEQLEPPKEEKLNHQESNNLFKSNNLLNNNVQDASKTDAQLDHTFVPDYVDGEFVNVVKPFFNNAKDIVKLWKSSSVATKKIAGLLFPNSAVNVIIKAFKDAVYQYKHGKVKKGFNGYFYGVLCNKLRDKIKEIDQMQQIKTSSYLKDLGENLFVI